MRLLSFIATLSFLGVAQPFVLAQSDRAMTKKTIEIRATAKVNVPAEVATVKVGYVNQAISKDAVYAENTRMAKKVVDALLAAKVPPSAIETESITLEREDEHVGDAPAKTLKFSADQEWRIHVIAADAQKIVDIAVGAGATNVAGVDWGVRDPVLLEAQAYAAAIGRAKKIAEQTASQSGLRLGEIISVVNSVNRFDLNGMTLNTSMASLSVQQSRTVEAVPLTLYPPSIEREASVTVTYAIAE
jgi:uncharacterized protein YggE